MSAHEPVWRPLEDQTEATPDRQLAGRDRHDEAYQYALRSRTHMWVVIVQHLATDHLLDQLEGKADGPALLDAESMIGPPAVVCYVCEQGLEGALRRRRCPGETT